MRESAHRMRRPARMTAAEIVTETVREHASSLLALARRHSLCADDAADAYQRALEIYLRKADTLDPDTRIPWVRTVLKHEAMALRAARQTLLAGGDGALEHQRADWPTDDERADSFDRLTQAAEALQQLKPHEAQALLLKAEGQSYNEISARTGWSYTKVNRSLTEGRRAFRRRYADIESGAECDRWTPLLGAVARGSASAADLVAIRPHLRACSACRAVVRRHRGAPSELAVLLPAGAGVGAGAGPAGDGGPWRWLGSLVQRTHDALAGGLPERLALNAPKLQAAADATTTGKLAAVAATTVAIAGGGVAAERADVGPFGDRSPRAERKAAAPEASPRALTAHLASGAAITTVSAVVEPAAPPALAPATSSYRATPAPARRKPRRRVARPAFKPDASAPAVTPVAAQPPPPPAATAPSSEFGPEPAPAPAPAPASSGATVASRSSAASSTQPAPTPAPAPAPSGAGEFVP